MKNLTAQFRKPFIWILLLFFIAVAILFYSDLLFTTGVNVSDWLGLQLHAVERLLLFSIVVVAATRGLWEGIFFLFVCSLAMMPRLFFNGNFLADSIYETIGVTFAGVLAVWIFESRRNDRLRREQLQLAVNTARREIQSASSSLKDEEKYLSELRSLVTLLGKAENLPTVFDSTAGKIVTMMGASGVLVFSIDRAENTCELKCHKGVSARFVSAVVNQKLEEGINSKVIKTGTTELVENQETNKDPYFDLLVNEGISSLLITPLLDRNGLCGTICVMMSKGRRFSQTERCLIDIIGLHVNQEMERIALTEEKDNAGRRFRDLFHNAHDAIWVQDFEGKILAANQATAEYTGYIMDEIVGAHVTKFIAPEGLETAREIRRKLLCGDHVGQPYEQKVTRKDGSLATIMLTTSLIMDEDGTPLFQHISRDVTRERRLSENLHLYARQITRAEEEERKRIARELHDDSIQALIILSRRVDDLASAQPKRAKIAEELDEIRMEIDSILARIRLFTQDLRPPTLDYLGLVPALRELISQIREQTGIQIDFLVNNEQQQHFTPEDELLIYRVIQEALRNVWRHAFARKVIVSLHFDGKDAVVDVQDDGSGFEIGEELRFVQAGKIGLAGMQERADLLGGNLSIQSCPGKGTKVTLKIPAERWKK